MSSKKSLERLVAGITGEPQPIERGELPQEVENALQVSEELKEALNRERTKDAGRRTGVYSPERGTKKNETRATFIVNKQQLRKIKYISLVDTRQIKAIIGEALTDYLNKWEAANGKINIRKFKA